jgi:hypothetical protein
MRGTYTTVRIESLTLCVTTFHFIIFLKVTDKFFSSIEGNQEENETRWTTHRVLYQIQRKMIFRVPPSNDDMGNFFLTLKTHGNGGYGEKLFVNLVDTPFYADGPRV